MKATRLPPTLTTEQFAHIINYHPEVVRRWCRAGVVKAAGRPWRIPSRELQEFGIVLEDAALALRDYEEAKASTVSGVIVK